MKALGGRAPAPGVELRANFYRIQGKPPNRRYVNWRPVMAETYHTPEAFGRLRLQE
jgi:hypothetical protein